MKPIPSSMLLHPENIHPALWRGSQLAHASCRTVSTGFDQLDRELPGLGWPLGALTELALSRSGIGEIHLLGSAFSRLPPERRIALVQPPYTPYAQCWHDWQLDARRLLWVQSGNHGDALWACEQILKHNTCAALLCWLANVHPGNLRRLHLAARQSDTLLMLLRPQTALRQSSIAPLRLSLMPSQQGLEISIVKRQGPSCDRPVFIALYPGFPSSRSSSHVSLDRALSALPQPGRAFSPVAH